MSTKKKGMAAVFTEIPLEDMEKFLKRGFRALRPTKGQQRGEFYFDLQADEENNSGVRIRVWSSISTRTGEAAGVGSDAIRVHLVNAHTGKPLEAGKAPIVKRTQNWRTNLQNLIEEKLELYDEKDAYWDARVGGEPKPVDVWVEDQPIKREIPLEKLKGDISPKQVSFIMSMLKKCDSNKWKQLKLDQLTGFELIPTENQVKTLSKAQGSSVIDKLLNSGHGRKYANSQSALLAYMDGLKK